MIGRMMSHALLAALLIAVLGTGWQAWHAPGGGAPALAAQHR